MNGAMWEGLKKRVEIFTLTDSPLLRIKCVEKNKALPLPYDAKNLGLKRLKTA